MEAEKIEMYIKIIFEREQSILRTGNKTWKLGLSSKKSPKAKIEYENANTLIDIFSNLKTQEENKVFVDSVLSVIMLDLEKYEKLTSISNAVVGPAALAFYTLIRLGYIEKTVEATYIAFANQRCILLLWIISDILSEDYNYFDLEQFNLLIRRVNEIGDGNPTILELKNKVLGKATEIGYRIITEEIRGVNIEVNRDKESVIQKISILGMGEEYEKFLDELDKYISSASGLVASGMIGNFRTFWEKIIIELARKIEILTDIEIAKVEKSAIANARLYLKKVLELSDADNSLISRYVDILHAEGGHAFTSNVEYFRLSRNIGIEILLMLLTKTQFVIKGKAG